ncbi:MAG: hypothetical protein CMG71_00810 [Candidatus Marinimicrobia bacterium]|nr:hypothetical protein [Candidatus Neomarinimicrobiota bacterium]|tara:strand:+ start:25833 stop:27632 length:1800 start_codon:yes stop_codon:yes gene_type:complete
MSALALILSREESGKAKNIFIIAEIANAHEGDVAKAELLIASAAEAGADAVKFQIYFADELFNQTHAEYKKYKQREWPFEVWEALVAAARKSDLNVGADVFGHASLHLALSLDIDFLKVHSSDVSNYSLLKKISQVLHPIILSAGGTTPIELARAINILEEGDTSSLCLMYGFQAFPTIIEDSHISRIPALQNMFDLHVGLADHIDADHEMAIHLALIALGLGCRIFEKHITLDRSAKGTDYFSSLEPNEFKQFVNQLKSGLIALGSQKISMGEAEYNYRSRMKKHVTAKHLLKSGTILSEKDLRLQRVEDYSLAPVPIDSWVGKKLLKSVDKDHVLKYEDIQQRVGLCIIARLQSSRLPGKALEMIAGKPSLGHLFERAIMAKHVAEPVLCTTTNVEDDKLANLAQSYDVEVIRGDSKNVLSRLVCAIDDFDFDIILRVTGDDIFLDPPHVELLINHLRKYNLDYVSAKELPAGTEAEAFTAETLKSIERYADDLDYTEYLTYYVDDPSFECGQLPVEEKFRRDYNLSLDTEEDLSRLCNILESIYDEKQPYTLDQVIEYIDDNPSLGLSIRIDRTESREIREKTKLDFSPGRIELLN